MNEASMQFELLVPDGVIVEEPILGLQAADASGRFGLWPNHEQFLTVLVPCVLTFRRLDGRERYAAADGGVLLLENNRLSVVTREALSADRLEDVAGAAAAMFAARKAQERTARSAFFELELTLLRELRQAGPRR